LSIGENTFVMEAKVIQPFASIAKNTVVWSSNHIGRHTRTGDNGFLAPHIVVSGNVEIGDDRFIGGNVTLCDATRRCGCA
jgi:UDP-3-O-[3-hydroxymyristoyl] glucosamine N-acyltransferase